jgi:transposase
MGDLDTRRQLIGYLGFVPSEQSTGESVKRHGMSKAGNGRVRHAADETAWSYRHRP